MEERLTYDPKSPLILDLVEEYITHYLYEEAETLLKDYLKENPITKKAVEIWMRIAEAQGDREKYEKLKEKFGKIEKVYSQEKLKIKEREFLQGREEIEEIIQTNDFPFEGMEESLYPLLKGFGLGEIQRIIMEDSTIYLYVTKDSKWTEIKFRSDTKFPQVTWIMKSLEKIK
jgi:hypothetical protein